MNAGSGLFKGGVVRARYGVDWAFDGWADLQMAAVKRR
jgi:hypothetical protein